MWAALAQGRRGQGIEGLVILVESNLVDHDSNLVDLSQDLDCGELVKSADLLGLHLSDVADSQHLDGTPLGFDDGAALSRPT